jgi:L-fuconolactonase
MIHDIPDDRWILRRVLEPALAGIAETDLVFDALVRPRHLPALVELTARHPSLSVVIDHAAKPDIANWRPGDAAFREWSGWMTALADRGLACKLSGLVTEARPAWEAADLRPYAEVVLDVFGRDGVIWGSDWPVVERRGGYRPWRRATEALLDGVPEAWREAILGRNAARVYRLPG